MTKWMVIRALKILIRGLEDQTLSPDEYILVGELLEWHKWYKGERGWCVNANRCSKN